MPSHFYNLSYNLPKVATPLLNNFAADAAIMLPVERRMNGRKTNFMIIT